MYVKELGYLTQVISPLFFSSMTPLAPSMTWHPFTVHFYCDGLIIFSCVLQTASGWKLAKIIFYVKSLNISVLKIWQKLTNFFPLFENKVSLTRLLVLHEIQRDQMALQHRNHTVDQVSSPVTSIKILHKGYSNKISIENCMCTVQGNVYWLP